MKTKRHYIYLKDWRQAAKPGTDEVQHSLLGVQNGDRRAGTVPERQVRICLPVQRYVQPERGAQHSEPDPKTADKKVLRLLVEM